MTAPTGRTLCPICHMLNRADARFCQKCGNNIWLANKYRVVRAIKEGGMGAVYEAIDDSRKRYALKALIDRFTDETERRDAIDRFHEEAALLRELKHPRIPRVYDNFEHGGRYYLAMDFVEGDDLEDLQEHQPNKRFPEATVLRWAAQIADVLDYLHERRLIYRDMKPSNIMIERGTNDVKLVDFGIAKLFQPHQRGTLIGTPGYSPPEQYQGQATPQSDVFALGATLHHLLTGRDPRDEAPFSFPPVRQLAPDVSAATEQAIIRALEMEQDQRWLSASAFKAALPIEVNVRRGRSKPQPTVTLDPSQMAANARAVPQPQTRQQAKPKQSTPQPSTATKPPQARRRPWLPLIIALTVVVLIILGQPFVSQQLEAMFGDEQPIATSTRIPSRVSQAVTREVTATVPLNSTTEEIQAALETSFTKAIQAEFGSTARISNNIPVAVEGAPPERISETADEATYRVKLRGQISYESQ